jgi:hypothetical protein
LQSNSAWPGTVLNKAHPGAPRPIGFVGFVVLNRQSRDFFTGFKRCFKQVLNHGFDGFDGFDYICIMYGIYKVAKKLV